MIQRMPCPKPIPNTCPPPASPNPPTITTVIQWWIDSGATSDKKVAQLDPPAKVLTALDEMFGPATPANEPKPLADLNPTIAQLQSDLGIGIDPLAADQPLLVARNASLRRTFGDADLAKLVPIANNIYMLNLAGTKVTDAGDGRTG